MSTRRSGLQKDIIQLLQNRTIRTQKEISGLLNKNPSSVNRSIKLLMKENILIKSDEEYLLTSKTKKEMQTWDRFHNPSLGLERITKELSSSGISNYFKNLDLMSNALKSSTSSIVGSLQSSLDSLNKTVSYSSVLDDFYRNSQKQGFLELMRITQESHNKIYEIMKDRFEPIIISVAKLSSSLNEHMKMQLKGSELISSKLAALRSLCSNDPLKKSLVSLNSGLLETTKNLQNYSISRVRLAQREFPLVGENLFKLETASQVYKNLSLSLPYIDDENIPEFYEIERDFSIEILKSKKLKKLLIKINPELDRKREGAWECILSDSQDKYSQSANSMINLVDWTLRELAPENEVRNYLKLGKSEKITRKMKLEYILRSKQDTKLIDFYIKNFLDIYDLLNKAKHSLIFHEGDVLESQFYMIEGIILFIVKAYSEN